MDPLSQAVLGASLSQSVSSKKELIKPALWIGALAGMAPDLDVLIQSPTDPLLFLEYHRQFTHSLIFIPFGALLCALFFHLFLSVYPKENKLKFKQIYLFSFLGYATHGLLDACTSYGTQLYWPFSDYRVAWNTVPIVDPFFTIPLLIFVVIAVVRKKRNIARYGFVYAVIFLSLGVIQKQRAESTLVALAESRGHKIERAQIKPAFANRHIWKLIYEYDNRYYVDAVRLLVDVTILEGDSIAKFNINDDLPWLESGSVQAKDIERFRWFSDDYLAISSDNPRFIMDMRYSYIPNQIHAMWGIEVNPYYMNEHIIYESGRPFTTEMRKQYVEMLFSSSVIIAP